MQYQNESLAEPKESLRQVPANGALQVSVAFRSVSTGCHFIPSAPQPGAGWRMAGSGALGRTPLPSFQPPMTPPPAFSSRRFDRQQQIQLLRKRAAHHGFKLVSLPNP